jgi:hypothetical protein
MLLNILNVLSEICIYTSFLLFCLRYLDTIVLQRWNESYQTRTADQRMQMLVL